MPHCKQQTREAFRFKILKMKNKPMEATIKQKVKILKIIRQLDVHSVKDLLDRYNEVIEAIR